ncbi:MAG: hypothetical protein GY750_17115 [Lentisphaerae bacterium]|nr:hypothetical protein [Lentisphaerota bacterium]MCP4103118.1 hypothetical protein [Lentisphaerota bacterium]
MFRSVYFISFHGDAPGPSNEKGYRMQVLQEPVETPREHMVLKPSHKSYPGMAIPMIRFNWNLIESNEPIARIKNDLKKFLAGIKLPAKIIINAHSVAGCDSIMQRFEVYDPVLPRDEWTGFEAFLSFTRLSEIFTYALPVDLPARGRSEQEREIHFHFMCCQATHFAANFIKTIPENFVKMYGIATINSMLTYSDGEPSSGVFSSLHLEETRNDPVNGVTLPPTPENDTRTIYYKAGSVVIGEPYKYWKSEHKKSKNIDLGEMWRMDYVCALAALEDFFSKESKSSKKYYKPYMMPFSTFAIAVKQYKDSVFTSSYNYKDAYNYISSAFKSVLYLADSKPAVKSQKKFDQFRTRTIALMKDCLNSIPIDCRMDLLGYDRKLNTKEYAGHSLKITADVAKLTPDKLNLVLKSGYIPIF